MVILVGVSVVLLASLVGLAVFVTRHRATSRRLSAVLTRLDFPGAVEGGDGEDSMSRLERLAESAVLRVSEAEAGAARMAGTLDELPPGVVVCDEQGRVVYRNHTAAGLTGISPDSLETEEALTEVLRAGLQGERRSCTLDLLGPPQRAITVAGRHSTTGGARWAR